MLCPLPLEYQAASSQARLKSCWALPPCSDLSDPLCAGGLFGGKSNQDEALEMYGRAANLYKMAKKWAKAGHTFTKIAERHLQVRPRFESATSQIHKLNFYSTVLESPNTVVESCVLSLYIVE